MRNIFGNLVLRFVRWGSRVGTSNVDRGKSRGFARCGFGMLKLNTRCDCKSPTTMFYTTVMYWVSKNCRKRTLIDGSSPVTMAPHAQYANIVSRDKGSQLDSRHNNKKGGVSSRRRAAGVF
jgi:hypothetical protein